MKKVLRIITRLNVGGPAIHVSNLVDLPGYETLVVHGPISKNEDKSPYKVEGAYTTVIEIPELVRELDYKNDLKTYYKLCQIIKNFKPDIIHTHTSKAGTLGRLAGISCSTAKIIHTFHGHTFHSYFNPMKEFMFKNIERFLSFFTDKIVVLSESQQKEISKVLLQKDSKFRIIRLGFDLEKFSKIIKKENKYSIIRVGIIGRLTAIKNHKMLLFAISSLPYEILQKFNFYIIGNGELKKDLMQLRDNLGLHKYVCFTGNQDNMEKVYSELDIVVLTSYNEGTPVSLIEAMAAGIPVVATDVGGVSDLLDEKLYMSDCCQRGMKIESDNDKQLTGYFENVVKFGVPSNVIKPARNYVLKNYGKDRLRKEIVGLYNNLLRKDKQNEVLHNI